jgi:hypothetical protein
MGELHNEMEDDKIVNDEINKLNTVQEINRIENY